MKNIFTKGTKIKGQGHAFVPCKDIVYEIVGYQEGKGYYEVRQSSKHPILYVHEDWIGIEKWMDFEFRVLGE